MTLTSPGEEAIKLTTSKVMIAGVLLGSRVA
jgi:hypothetical protein